jgi:hypothetical protein
MQAGRKACAAERGNHLKEPEAPENVEGHADAVPCFESSPEASHPRAPSGLNVHPGQTPLPEALACAGQFPKKCGDEECVMGDDDRQFMEIHRDLDDHSFYALSEEDRGRCYLLFMFRPAATILGYWRTCRLPSCRRAKACRGTAPPEGCHPPCTADGSGRHEDILNFCSKFEPPSEVAPADAPVKSKARETRNDNPPRKGGSKKRMG